MLQIRQINESIKVGLLDLNIYSQQNGLLTKRDAERAGTIFLLGQMLKRPDFELSYTEHRKPYLKNMSEHISVSHSHDKLAVIINKTGSTGIDIELIREKVKQIQHKFLNDSEKEMACGDTETLISFWAAKETLYKVYGLKEIDFKEHLFIEEMGDTEIIARVETAQFKKRYRLASEKHDNYRMVYVTDEI